MDEDFINENEQQAQAVQDTQDETKGDEKQEMSGEVKIFQKAYAGPNVRKKGLLTGQVFLNGLPFSVQEAIEQCPAVGKLIVDVEKYEETARRTKIAGTAEYVYYNKISSEVF